MSRQPAYPDESDDQDDDSDLDPEGPDRSEMDYSDEPDLAVCPHCRRMISEEAERCPHCGQWVDPGQTPMSIKAWIVVGAIVLSLILLLLRSL